MGSQVRTPPDAMPIFQLEPDTGHWLPSARAAGPFRGLQGGAVTGLLTAEIEALAEVREWGDAVSVSAWFLGPTPMSPLRTRVAVLREGGRVSVVDNTVWAVGQTEPSATARVTLMRRKPLDLVSRDVARPHYMDPLELPSRETRAPHGGAWFMNAMEARTDGEVVWFRMLAELVVGGGPLSRVVGPADWAHGIHRPVRERIGDPNPNLSVRLWRPGRGDWIGIRPHTDWYSPTGTGLGRGVLLDLEGEIGVVSMDIALSNAKV